MENLFQIIQFFGGIPTFIVLFAIFLFVFRHHMSKNDEVEQKAKEAFWKREQDSLVVRKKQIPEDLYIPFNEKAIPTFTKEDYALMNNTYLYTLQQSLHLIANSKMLNLSHLLNSEIRMNYGTANLPLIEAYEENYINCIKNIYKLAKGLHEKGHIDESLILLNEGVRIDSDITYHYHLMAKIYQKTNQPQLIIELINQLKTKNPERFSKIIPLLEEHINTDDHAHE